MSGIGAEGKIGALGCFISRNLDKLLIDCAVSAHKRRIYSYFSGLLNQQSRVCIYSTKIDHFRTFLFDRGQDSLEVLVTPRNATVIHYVYAFAEVILEDICKPLSVSCLVV